MLVNFSSHTSYPEWTFGEVGTKTGRVVTGYQYLLTSWQMQEAKAGLDDLGDPFQL